MLIHTPNIRATFEPDPGYTLFDFDLDGADARVVGWDADEPNMKRAFREGKKIHAVNALDIYGPGIAGIDGKQEPTYTRVKRAIHATHYGGTPSVLAKKCKMSLPLAKEFQARYFTVRPNIKAWMERIEFELQRHGGVSNIFGYSINFFQRGADAYTEALAWRPQSTIARVTEIAMVRLHRHVPNFQILLQVHDSLVGQIRNDRISRTLREIDAILSDIVVPYGDPLIIPWGIKSSRESWGKLEKIKWSDWITSQQPIDAEREDTLQASLPGLAVSVSSLHGEHRGAY